MSTYLDTSALAKLYVNEPGSEAFSDFLASCEDARVSSLAVTEMHSLVYRHCRLGHLDEEFARDALDLLQADIEVGRFRRHVIRDGQVRAAAYLLRRLHPLPLRTLDALHLAVCESRGIDALATADRSMAAAAEQLGMAVETF